VGIWGFEVAELGIQAHTTGHLRLPQTYKVFGNFIGLYLKKPSAV
jgi:hypothetical protein